MTQERNLTLRNDLAITPAELVENASTQASILMDIVEKTHCFQTISGKKYLQVEAWETIGAFNRVHAVTRQISSIIREGEVVGYQADVGLLEDGIIVGGASMPCFFTENACKGKEGDAKHKACMSAAQTFATSKAYRMNYSYVAILAGYQPTPAEEMTGEAVDDRPANLKHWCEKHKTKFFQRGAMKGYAHPIEGTEGTKEWCNEPEEKTQPEPSLKTAPQPAQSKTSGIEKQSNTAVSAPFPYQGNEEAPQSQIPKEVVWDKKGKAEERPAVNVTGAEAPPTSPIDLDWVRETMGIIKWTEVTAKSWISGNLKVKTGDDTLEKILLGLPADKLQAFQKKLQDLRSVSGK